MSRAGAGVLGFVLGVASVAALVHFSPEVRRALVGDAVLALVNLGAAGVRPRHADVADRAG